jgi:hypothetical protein
MVVVGDQQEFSLFLRSAPLILSTHAIILNPLSMLHPFLSVH